MEKKMRKIYILIGVAAMLVSLRLLAMKQNEREEEHPQLVLTDAETKADDDPEQRTELLTGDQRTDQYLPLLDGKRVALFSNHTGLAGDCHILDLLMNEGVNVVGAFSPEHGFRGKADAGEHVKSSVDPQTGVPIWSLYNGREKRPSDEVMRKFDCLVVDIQDVGLRFYTYYITMRSLMDVCALYDKEVVILDRPNPNGHLVDGPILERRLYSGVGCLPVPVLHGMTLGELARMMNGEKWLPGGRPCTLTVIPCLNYTHRTFYQLPVPPSPNLPDMKSVYLYPSMCLFEGTTASLGRGTEHPFQMYGHPQMKGEGYSFVPKSRPGAKNPPLLNQRCNGVDLRLLGNEEIRQQGVNLDYVIDAYRRMPAGVRFFTPFFDKLIGTGYVRTMIEQGKSADEIRERWRNDVESFKKLRKPYLLYEE